MRTEEPIERMSRQQYEELLAGHIFHLTGLPYRPHPRNTSKITVPANKYRAEKIVDPLQLTTTLGSGSWNITRADIDRFYLSGMDPMTAAQSYIQVGV